MMFFLILNFIFLSFNVQSLTYDLTGRIRDMHQSHPDFEPPFFALDFGIVSNTLGADGKPVYANPGEIGRAHV